MIRIKNIKLVLGGALVVPVALASLACSPIYADDPNGVKREIFTPGADLEDLNARIQSAIESGAIPQAQVDAGKEILKRGLLETGKTGFEPRWDIEEIKAKISAGVENGEITQAEADEKLASLEDQPERGQRPYGKKGQHHKKPFMDIETIKAKILAAVESGEITQAEADERLSAIEAKRNERQEKMAAKLEEIKAKISAAVENGEITQTEADEKLAALEGRTEKGQRPYGKKGQHHKKPFMDIETIKTKISAAVENGEMTQAEADEKLARLQDRTEKDHRPYGKKGQQHKKPFMDIETIKAKISAAVESGEITQTEADEKLARLEGRTEKDHRPYGKKGQQHKKPFMDIETIKAKISAAVESGEITQTEADEKLLFGEGKPKKATYY